MCAAAHILRAPTLKLLEWIASFKDVCRDGKLSNDSATVGEEKDCIFSRLPAAFNHKVLARRWLVFPRCNEAVEKLVRVNSILRGDQDKVLKKSKVGWCAMLSRGSTSPS